MDKSSIFTNTSVKIIHCPDEEGFIWAMVVAEDSCESGIVLGPPAGLPLKIHNALVEEKYYKAFDLIGKRKQLLELLRKLKVDNEKDMLRHILFVYQQTYWGE